VSSARTPPLVRALRRGSLDDHDLGFRRTRAILATVGTQGGFYLQLSVRVSRTYSHLPYSSRLPKLIVCPGVFAFDDHHQLAEQGVYPAVCPESTLSCGTQALASRSHRLRSGMGWTSRMNRLPCYSAANACLERPSIGASRADGLFGVAGRHGYP